MYVERSIKRKFEIIKESYPMIALVGARQSGKTTFLKEQIKGRGARYLLFDDPDVKEIFETDIKGFEQQYLDKKVSIFDEVHYCRDAGQKLKYLADKGYKIWLTSSSETMLGKDVLSYLVGRVSMMRLYPFSFQEFCSAKGQKTMTRNIEKRLTREHMIYGGYPKAVLSEDDELKKIILRDLHETMLLKDVARTFAIEDDNSLEKTARYISNNIGNILSYDSATKTLGITFITLKKYLDALEKSYLIKLVSPFHKNKNKEISKRPKMYFIDTGMRNAVRRTFPQDIGGELFENYVFSELLKSGYQLKYWRTKAGAETDFVLEDGEDIIPVECKLQTEKVNKGLRSFIKTYRPRKAYIVNHEAVSQKVEVDGCNVLICGISELMRDLSS